MLCQSNYSNSRHLKRTRLPLPRQQWQRNTSQCIKDILLVFYQSILLELKSYYSSLTVNSSVSVMSLIKWQINQPEAPFYTNDVENVFIRYCRIWNQPMGEDERIRTYQVNLKNRCVVNSTLYSIYCSIFKHIPNTPAFTVASVIPLQWASSLNHWVCVWVCAHRSSHACVIFFFCV